MTRWFAFGFASQATESMSTPKVLKVVCRGTADLEAKNHFYKVLSHVFSNVDLVGTRTMILSPF